MTDGRHFQVGAVPLPDGNALFTMVDVTDSTRIEAALRDLAQRQGLKPRQAFQPIRAAVTGSNVSPGLFESIELLGREETLARLDAAAG